MSDFTGWQGCQRPNAAKLKGRHVTLMAFRNEVHGEQLWQALGGEDTNKLIHYFPNGPYQDHQDFSTWLETANKRGEYITYLISANETGAIVGMASYMRISPEHGSIEIGAVAHGPAMAKSPLATEAQYLFARYIFEDLGYRRYEWKLDNDNKASHAAAQRLGFVYEGCFRQHMVVKGRNRDTAWYAMTDSEWPTVRNALEHWLSDDNFDKNGQQRQNLAGIREKLKTSD
ncbi:MAG: acetyltransferase [Rhodomicrobium sp.]|nr:MAG: acetyltransferase [Rhodomicrobium sp.]